MPLPARSIFQQCAGALLLVPLLAVPAAAGPGDDAYIAARDRHVAEIAKLDGDPAKQDALFAADEAARADLLRKMSALLGPLSFKGLEQTPTFSPGALFQGDLGSGNPDGLLFSDAKGDARIFVSTQPVFADWLAREAKLGVPGFDKGLPAALSSDDLYTFTVGQDAAFRAYFTLPLPAPAGETTYAAVGLFSQDDGTDAPPADLVVARLAGGRLTIGAEAAPEAKKAIAACTQVWKRFAAKANQLQAAARKGKGVDDPRFEEAMQVSADGTKAFRDCYATEAAKQPFYAPLTARAQALAAKMRGN
ncbi:hypothetical protein [Aquabacter cavernae]|uniref:hypothetical protein n=1 Tax=Aquabacter cavernae TaxID=2496029 RepID=UPI000F8DD9E8|nr:hypothetical protein [Aquabacter cavernae]